MNRVIYTLAFTVVSGCSSVEVERDYFETTEVIEKAMPVLVYDTTPVTGSIYRDEVRSAQFGFRKNFSLGDIITVVLNESTQAQRSNGINTLKEVNNSPLSQLQTTFGAGLPVGSSAGNIIKRGLKSLTFAEQNRTDKGLGTSDQTGSLNGAIAVIVTRILPNGTLFVEGKKDLIFSEGREEIYVSGLVKPSDVQPDETVLSSRIAQANIAYKGRGDLADVARASWGTKVFNKLWPF